MFAKHYSVAEEINRQEQRMHEIVHMVSAYYDVAIRWLNEQNLHPSDKTGGNPATEIANVTDALTFSSEIEHLENINRRLKFPDGTAILLDSELLTTLMKSIPEELHHKQKLMIVILLLLKLEIISESDQSLHKSHVATTALKFINDYKKAEKAYNAAIKKGLDFRLDELVTPQETAGLLEPIEKHPTRRRLSLPVKALLVAGALGAAAAAEWYFVAQKTAKNIRQALTAENLSPEEYVQFLNKASILTRGDIEKAERQHIQDMINLTIQSLFVKDTPGAGPIYKFSPTETQQLHDYIDSALFRLSGLNKLLTPDKKTLEEFYTLVDTLLAEAFPKYTTIQATYNFTDKTYIFRPIALAEARDFCLKYQTPNNPLTEQEIVKIGIALNIFGFKTNLDPRLLLCLIAQESSFDKNAIGKDGERSMIQIMPINLSLLQVNNWHDPFQVIRAEAYHLYWGGAVWDTGSDNDIFLALVYYNAGTTTMNDYLAKPVLSVNIPYSKNLSSFVKNNLAIFDKYVLKGNTLSIYNIMRERELVLWMDWIDTQQELGFLTATQAEQYRQNIHTLWAETQKKPFTVKFSSFVSYAPKILKQHQTYAWSN